MIKINNKEAVSDEAYTATYSKNITNNNLRNELVKQITDRYDGKILVLVSFINHGKILNELIPNSKFLWGDIDSQERYDEVQSFINDEGRRVLIGSNIFSEGVDFSNGVDAIVIASADAGFRMVVQKLGRALRMNAKGFVDVWDFWDSGNKMLDKRSLARHEIYQAEGHDVTLI